MKTTLILPALLLSAGLLSAQDSTRVVELGYGRSISKEESSAAVDAVWYEDFSNSSQNQILNALYGLLPGLNLSQSGSGARPDDTYPTISVRGRGSYSGNHTLVIVDGVPRDASYIDVHEVESVTVLKDAASLAIYGVRGADGAVLIKTKRGSLSPFKIRAGYSSGVTAPFRVAQMASPAEYATALNEARTNDGLTPYFSSSDISALGSGSSTLIPSTDWQSLMLRDLGCENKLNFSVSGGSENIKAFVYADWSNNRGFFNNTSLIDGLNTQNNYDALKVRSNLDITITHHTKVVASLAGRIQQHSTPYNGTSLKSMYTAPTVGFPVMYDGIWARSVRIDNPVWYTLGTGENTTFSRMLSADLAIRQDLGMLLKGLSAEVRLSYDNSADIMDRKSFGSEYYVFSPLYDGNGLLSDYSLAKYGNATEMDFSSFLSYQFMSMSAWGKLNYENTFDDSHKLAATLLWSRNKRTNTGVNTSFVHHDWVFAADYSYEGKYLASVSVDRSGSSYMPKGDKFRVYPAASLGWVLSKEDFFKDAKFVDFLKLRASYGLSGMDANLSYDMDIQFNGSGNSYMFVSPSVLYGAAEGALPSVGIEPELDRKADIGLEFRLFKGLSGEIDAFYNRRTNLRTSETNTTSEVIGIGLGDSFEGETVNKGIDLALSWEQKVGGFSYRISGTASFARNKIVTYSEPYKPEDYLFLQGNSIGRFYGLTTDGYYRESDFDEAGNLLPGVVSSTFDSVRSGDVKYKDLNNDGIIDNYDYSYRLKSLLPELYYGIRLSAEYKGIGVDLKFQGVNGCTVPTTLSSIYQPLYGGDKNISKHYLQDYWTEDNTDARYPRLGVSDNKNNYLASDLWTEDGSFLKLREAEIYCNLPQSLCEKLTIEGAKVFVRGNNLLSFDNIKILDPENVSFDYPTARLVALGVNVNF